MTRAGEGAAALRMEIRRSTDGMVVGALARRFAESGGFGTRAAAEIAISVAELASNVWRHGGGAGTIELTCDERGLAVHALDRGPGLDAARSPGARKGSGLGEGVAAVRRLMDDVRMAAREGGGLAVWAWKARARAR